MELEKPFESRHPSRWGQWVRQTRLVEAASVEHIRATAFPKTTEFVSGLP